MLTMRCLQVALGHCAFRQCGSGLERTRITIHLQVQIHKLCMQAEKSSQGRK